MISERLAQALAACGLGKHQQADVVAEQFVGKATNAIKLQDVRHIALN